MFKRQHSQDEINSARTRLVAANLEQMHLEVAELARLQVAKVRLMVAELRLRADYIEIQTTFLIGFSPLATQEEREAAVNLLSSFLLKKPGQN